MSHVRFGDQSTLDSFPCPTRLPAMFVRSLTRAFGVFFALVALVLGAVSARVASVVANPRIAAKRLSTQVSWLERKVEGDTPTAMQALFPDSAFFTYLLTGLAAAQDETRPTADRSELIASLLHKLDDPNIVAPFSGS